MIGGSIRSHCPLCDQDLTIVWHSEAPPTISRRCSACGHLLVFLDLEREEWVGSPDFRLTPKAKDPVSRGGATVIHLAAFRERRQIRAPGSGG